MGRFFATTLAQIVGIIATSSALTFLLFIAMMYYPGAPPNPPWPWQATYRIADFVELIRNVPEAERPTLINSVLPPVMSARLTSVPTACSMLTLDTRDLEAALKTELPELPELTARACVSADPNAQIQVLAPLGQQMLDIRIGKVGRSPPRITFPFVGALVFLFVGVAVMSTWAVSRVIRPLRRLSDTVDAFGQDIAVSPLDEEGPLEIRRAARAFNLMQQRIARSMQDRTRMLAAISHDLRTPLTRMRLQLDIGPREIARDKLRRDVDLMQSMVTSALGFLSGSFEREEEEWVDLAALLSTLCDEYEETGAAVSYQGPAQIRFFCRPNALNRALVNLVENGLHFGTTVLVTAAIETEIIRIDVADDGPGIPQERREDVTSPFVRLDPARQSRPGSVGLGLSIVKEIVEGHGGALELGDNHPTGLVARMEFRRPAAV